MNSLSIKEYYRKLIKYTPTYLIQKYKLKMAQVPTVENIVRKWINDVPFYEYYKNYLNEDSFDITHFPILHKHDMLGHERELVSKRVSSLFLRKSETGGTSGVSLTIFGSSKLVAKNAVIVNQLFSKIGNKLKVGILRGLRPSDDLMFQKVTFNQHVLSSYKLNSKTIGQYINYIRRTGINCLHVYPSSISILARLVLNHEATCSMPEIKGILASSEIFDAEEKNVVRKAFPNAKIIDYYGQSELVASAVSINGGHYTFDDRMGFVEFIDTGQKTKSGNRIAEIVATAVMNHVMPLIRYATEDYVELDDEGNVVGIIGRTSDFVVNKHRELVPCIAITRDQSKKNMTSFQYLQDEVGKMTFAVVVNEHFTEQERLWLKEDMQTSFSDMDVEVEVVNDLVRTKRGKVLHLVQKLNLDEFK